MPKGFVMKMVAASLLAAPIALAQQPQKSAPGFPDGLGKEILVAKCFQCHGPTMWMAQRQDRRAWESALYRMVGRGALWTEAEITEMADYLGTVYAKDAR